MTRFAVIAALCLFSLTAKAQCPSLESRLAFVAAMQEQFGGTHQIVSGAVAENFMRLFNSAPPETDIRADTLLIYRSEMDTETADLFFAQGTQSCTRPFRISRPELERGLLLARRGAI